MNLLAPGPGMIFSTRGGNFTSDTNSLVSNVPAGLATLDLVESGCVPIGFSPVANPRNFVDGGDFTVNPWQRNVPALASGGVISTPVAAAPTYFADRFFAVGGASSAILMANVADTTVAGFANSLLLTRQAANANTAPILFGQVVESADTIRAQGQSLALSFWARAAANYSGGSLSVYLVYGTGQNQTAASMVAGTWTGYGVIPLTPTGASGSAGAPALQPVSSSMTRYGFTGVVPVSATQLGFYIAWTPAGTAGAADGLYLNGFQLEGGSIASVFEHEDVQIILEECQRFAYVQSEPASPVFVASGNLSTTTNANIILPLPQPMLKAPSVTAVIGAFKVNAANANFTPSVLAGNVTHTPTQVGLTATVTGATAGQGCQLNGGGGSGVIVVSADF